MNKTLVKQNVESYFNLFDILPSTQIISDPEFGERSNIIKTENPFFFFNASFNLCPKLDMAKLVYLIDLYKSDEKSSIFWIDNDEIDNAYSEMFTQAGLLKLEEASIVSGKLTVNDLKEVAELTLIKASSVLNYSRWLNVFIEVYGFDKALTEEFLQKWGLANTKKHPDSFLNFILEEGDEILAVGSLYITGNFAGLYNLAVPEKHRRKGYAESLTKQMAKYAYDREVTHIGGAGSAMGMELYKNFDIKVHGTYSLWAYFHS